jgi:hypothetical protein
MLGESEANADVRVFADIWFKHPSFNGDVTQGKDFGLVHLTEPLLDITPVRLYRGNLELGNQTTFVGYGRRGTGLTGDTQPYGFRRGGTNVVDVFGPSANPGWSVNVMLTDFDNPLNPGDSIWGSAVPLPMESQVAFYDSGSPWYMELGGLNYVIGIGSFRVATDGNANSDYGDGSGATRVTGEVAWIDANHDQTKFWNGSMGNWNQDNSWIAGPQPAANNAAVIDMGAVSLTDAGETAKYVFVVGSGQLELANDLTANNLMLRDSATLEIDNPTGVSLLSGSLKQTGGILKTNIRGTELGSGYSRLSVGGTAELGGTLQIAVNDGGGSYSDPDVRGAVDEFTVLVAGNVEGSYAAIDYDGTSLTEGTNYVGPSQNGDDGMFRIIDTSSTEVTLINYLALAGDANGDLAVDGLDFTIWNQHKFSGGTDWTTGDFNQDGFTDGLDFTIWNQNKFTFVPIPPVPEPSAGALALVGIPAFIWLSRAARFPLRRQGTVKGKR